MLDAGAGDSLGPPAPGADRVRLRIAVTGLVQGVGFRPFVYATATELGLTGSVINDSLGVVVDVEGERARTDTFLRRLREHPPPLAIVDRVTVGERPPRGGTGFFIGDSTRSAGGRTLA